jgi:basic membrane protein A
MVLFRTFFLVYICLPILVACTSKDSSEKAKPAEKSVFKVGLVLDKGGKDDKSFNAAAYKGAQEAVKSLGIELKDVESPDNAAFEPALRTFGERNYPLVISIGFSQKDAVSKVAPQYPKTNFVIIDSVVEGSNVKSVMFDEHQGSYLVGYLAALATKTSTVGFIGGMDIALIRRFQMGFEAGVKAANPKVKVLVNYVGITGDAWANPSRGKELALSQYGRKADIIFGAAGATNMGIFDAAEEKKLYAIGVDSNQNWIKPGLILTSMLKRVDVAVLDVITAAVNGKFTAGTQYYGLKEKGIDIAIDEHNSKVVFPYLEKVSQAKQLILDGKTIVPDYYLEQKKK